MFIDACCGDVGEMRYSADLNLKSVASVRCSACTVNIC